MFELLSRVSKKHHHIRLNYAFCSDPMWLHTFLGSWNGKAMMRSQDQWVPAVEIYIDAAGEVGCEAWWGTHWLQLRWANNLERYSNYTEISVSSCIGMCCVGPPIKRQKVQLHCNNEATVAVLNMG